ncbi:MAG: hypothetical protein SW833_06815 [Cyanobacteriota bacterium]|nr:hypothetical protein [Cyanobacteriota bacterium]
MPVRSYYEEIPWEEFILSRTPEYLRLCEQLESLGFHPAASSEIPTLNLDRYFTVFSHRTSTAIATLTSSVNAQKEELVLEFTQVYIGGMHLDVTNSPKPYLYPPWKQKRLYRAPRVSRPDELYQLFTAIVEKVRDRKRTRLIQGRELEEIAQFSNNEIRQLVRTGFLRLSTDGTTARCKLWSAYYMSWRLLLPLRAILNRLDERAAYTAAGRAVAR